MTSAESIPFRIEPGGKLRPVWFRPGGDTTQMTGKRTNWAGNVTFGAERFHRPASVPELQHLVARSRPVPRPGTGHPLHRHAGPPGYLGSWAGAPPPWPGDPPGPGRQPTTWLQRR